jgi:hypothetical protein
MSPGSLMMYKSPKMNIIYQNPVRVPGNIVDKQAVAEWSYLL